MGTNSPVAAEAEPTWGLVGRRCQLWAHPQAMGGYESAVPSFRRPPLIQTLAPLTDGEAKDPGGTGSCSNQSASQRRVSSLLCPGQVTFLQTVTSLWEVLSFNEMISEPGITGRGRAENWQDNMEMRGLWQQERPCLV